MIDAYERWESVTKRHIVDLVVEFFEPVDGPFSSYPNPQRDDGVFIGQSKPIFNEPDHYRDKVTGLVVHHKNWKEERIDGLPIYDATPRNAVILPFQVDHDESHQILARLNQRGK